MPRELFAQKGAQDYLCADVPCTGGGAGASVHFSFGVIEVRSRRGLRRLGRRPAGAHQRTHGPRGRPMPAAVWRLRLYGRIPVSRFWTDARVLRMYGGTSELMKELVARGCWGGNVGMTGAQSTPLDLFYSVAVDSVVRAIWMTGFYPKPHLVSFQAVIRGPRWDHSVGLFANHPMHYLQRIPQAVQRDRAQCQAKSVRDMLGRSKVLGSRH